jgi:hypothetical protein
MVRFRYLFVDGVQRRDVVLAADCLGEQRQIRCGKNLLLEVARVSTMERSGNVLHWLC